MLYALTAWHTDLYITDTQYLNESTPYHIGSTTAEWKGNCGFCQGKCHFTDLEFFKRLTSVYGQGEPLDILFQLNCLVIDKMFCQGKKTVSKLQTRRKFHFPK